MNSHYVYNRHANKQLGNNENWSLYLSVTVFTIVNTFKMCKKDTANKVLPIFFSLMKKV